jgi:hypothetical protein
MIRYIKGIYKKKDVQHDLTLDSIYLFAINITGTYKNKKMSLSQKEIDEFVEYFENSLYECNNLNIEWDQTS